MYCILVAIECPRLFHQFLSGNFLSSHCQNLFCSQGGLYPCISLNIVTA